jgi:hypothetical protein
MFLVHQIDSLAFQVLLEQPDHALNVHGVHLDSFDEVVECLDILLLDTAAIVCAETGQFA